MRMLTKKEKILIRPFMDQKFENHRRKVSEIDFRIAQH